MKRPKLIVKKPVYITTRGHLEWSEERQQYIAVSDEGYIYSGPLALATTPPTLEVTNWAFYNDGTESGATIIGSVNTNPTLDVDTIYQFRTGLEETSGNAAKNQTPQLQYNHNSAGWNNVTATSSVVQAAASGNLTDGTDTTQRITAFTYDSSNEGVDEADGLAGGATADLISNGFEALYSFQILSGDVANNDTVQLRIVNGASGDALYDVYNQTDASITVNEPTNVTAALTTVSAAAAVGSVGVAVTVALTGVLSTGSVGSVTAGVPVTVPISGVQSTGAVGSVAPSTSLPITGVSGGSAVGSVSVPGGGQAALSGVASTSAVGTVTTASPVALTGVSSSGSVGDVAFTESGTVALTGVVATSAVGSVSVPSTGVAGTIYSGNQKLINLTDTAFPLEVAVDNAGGVTGLTVTASIREVGNSSSYLDFNDSTFKTSSWAAKSQALAEIGGGFYGGTLNVSAITNFPAGNNVSVEYTITGSVEGISTETLTVNTQLAEIHAANFNRRKHDLTANTITLYEADGVTPLKVFDATDDLTEITPQ